MDTGRENVWTPNIMGEPWEWRTLGVVNPGSGGLWEWRTLGVADPGSGEPWEWCILGMAGPFRGPTNFNFFVTGKLSTVPYRISHAESSGVVGFLLSRQVFEKIGFQDFIRNTPMFSFRHPFRWPTNFDLYWNWKNSNCSL